MKLGLVMLDLNGGDYSFYFVDALRWKAILDVPIEGDGTDQWAQDQWQEAVLNLLTDDLVEGQEPGPGTVIRSFYGQRGVFEGEGLPFGCSGIIGILPLQAT